MKTLINLSFSVLVSLDDIAVKNYARQHNLSFKDAFKALAKIVILDAIAQKL